MKLNIYVEIFTKVDIYVERNSMIRNKMKFRHALCTLPLKSISILVGFQQNWISRGTIVLSRAISVS